MESCGQTDIHMLDGLLQTHDRTITEREQTPYGPGGDLYTALGLLRGVISGENNLEITYAGFKHHEVAPSFPTRPFDDYS